MSVISDYKVAHEAFVSNIKGTSIGCIIACLLHIPAYILMLKISQFRRKPRIIRDYCLLTVPMLLTITVVVDHNYWSLACVTALLIYVIKSDTHDSDGSVDATDMNIMSSNNERPERLTGSTTYLTLFKGANVLVTCLAILAVDFKVFPRRFAKTETFGISLMDAGVGAFIISSAITSRHARGLLATTSAEYCGKSSSLNCEQLTLAGSGTILRNISKFQPFTMQRFCVLLLGVGRFIVLKVANYQEHVSEYGTHWNFFVTLFFVWTITDIIHAVLPRKFIGCFAVAVLAVYQALLLFTPLTDYVFSSPRTNIISANKEGIVSLLGFVPMFLLTETLAYGLLYERAGATLSRRGSNNCSSTLEVAPINAHTRDVVSRPLVSPPSCVGDTSNETSNSVSSERTDGTSTVVATMCTENEQLAAEDTAHKKYSAQNRLSCCNLQGTTFDTNMCTASTANYWCLDKQLVQQLALTSALLWIAWAVAAAIQPTSRRLVNLAYVLLNLALSLTLLMVLYVVDHLGGGPTVRILTLEYMSKHSLTVFLAANVLTGAINISVRTIYASRPVALAILFVYSFAVTTFAWLADSVVNMIKTKKLRR